MIQPDVRPQYSDKRFFAPQVSVLMMHPRMVQKKAYILLEPLPLRLFPLVCDLKMAS